MSPVTRVVFDCNIFAQALMNPQGPAGACLQAVFDGEIDLFIAEFVLIELRELPDKPTPAKAGVTLAKIEKLISLLQETAEYVSVVPAAFVHPIDPDDSDYVNLALAAGAKRLVSRDRHLINLQNPAKPWSADFRARFPDLRVVSAEQLLLEIRMASRYL
jgi:uncharacterized protein